MGTSIEYCREVESYLCRKNGGHLVRIVGPAFEQVKRWAEQGIPLRIVFRGIDATSDRHQAKPGRRRPLRIEFCEADVLEAFDDWRRTTGVSEAAADDEAPVRKEPLAAHIERAVQRLLAVRTNGDAALADVIASTVATLDELVTTARQARGDARAAIIARLAELDAALLSVAREHVDPTTAASLRKEAGGELAPFVARMTPEARERALALAFDRYLRESLALPTLTYE